MGQAQTEPAGLALPVLDLLEVAQAVPVTRTVAAVVAVAVVRSVRPLPTTTAGRAAQAGLQASQELRPQAHMSQDQRVTRAVVAAVRTAGQVAQAVQVGARLARAVHHQPQGQRRLSILVAAAAVQVLLAHRTPQPVEAEF